MPSIFHPVRPIHWTWITLSGSDALDFLHRITTVHVKDLALGTGKRGCILNPQGKIRAYFTLWHYAPDDFGFEFDAGAEEELKKSLLAAIDQYTFFEKITLADTTGTLDSRWIFLEPGETFGPASVQPGHTLAIDEEIRICHQGELDFGRSWITVWGRPERLAQWLERSVSHPKVLGLEEIEEWRISSLRPRASVEITENMIPLELGLRDSISENKGCYPGQEVIEKIISLGAPSRRLAKIQGKGHAPVPGEKIFNLAEPPGEVGHVTSVTHFDGSFTALGLIRKIHAKEGLQIKLSSGGEGAITQLSSYA